MLNWYELYKSHKLTLNFFGFDSFVGLPVEEEDANSIWQTGQFSVEGQINPELLNKEGLKIIPGWFDSTLSKSTALSFGNTQAGLVHMDCDTYSSTITCWEWLIEHDLIAKGALVVYDDWGAYLQAGCDEYCVGEAKAHKDIESKYNLKFTDLGKYVIDPTFYEVKIFRYE